MTALPFVLAQTSGTPDAAGLVATLLGGLAFIAATMVVYYIVFAASLTVIARKLGRTDGWMAWVPIANVVLFCRLANRSLAWILAFVIPLVNMVAAILLWNDIARARGKSSWSGLLVIIPVLNLILPVYLASGPGASTAWPRSKSPASSPRRCPSCGTTATSGDAFCGECGARVPHAAAPSAATKEADEVAAAKPAGRGLIIAGASLVILIGLGWGAYAWLTSYSAPDRKPPALPARVRGIMTEFPVDDRMTAQAKPSSVVTQAFGPGEKDVKLPQAWLPPGVPKQSLAQDANAVMAAAYRVTPTDAPVAVTVLETKEVPKPETIPMVPYEMARDITRATGGSQTGVAVERPNDDTYRGSKIAIPHGGVAYVLSKDNAPVVVIIYAADASMAPIADRLAANVGNGEGLNDYADMQDSLWALPSDSLDDLVLRELVTQTPDEIGLTEAALQNSAGTDTETQQMLSRLSAFIPVRFTTARYGDRSGREWNAIILDYGPGGKAWRNWTMLRWTIGAIGMQPVALGSGEARYVDSGSDRVLIFHQGPYLVALEGPADEPLSRFSAWADRFQM